MVDVPILVCTAGALSGQRFEVPAGGLDIGRAEDSAVRIQDDGVSRYHARLIYDNGQLWLQDAGSRNGVFVNKARVTGHRAMKVGDELTIGKHTFEVCWAEDASDTVDLRKVGAEEPKAEAPSAAGDGSTRWWWPFS